MIISPWGDVLDQLPEGEGIVCAKMDLAEVERVRREMPLIDHQRSL